MICLLRKQFKLILTFFSMSTKKRGRQSTPKVTTPKKQAPIRPNFKKLIQRVKEHKLKETKEQEISNELLKIL